MSYIYCNHFIFFLENKIYLGIDVYKNKINVQFYVLDNINWSIDLLAR